MKIFKTINKGSVALAVAFCAMLLTASCGGNKPYKIDGTVEGLGTQNVTAIYHTGTALNEVSTNAVNSAFHIEGMVENPVVIEIFNNQNHRIGCIVAEKGDEIKVKFKAGDPYFMEAEGNETSEQLADFLKANSGSLNKAIENQIALDPSAQLSMVLATYYYNVGEDAARADSVLSLFDYATIVENPMLQGKAEEAARLANAGRDVVPLELYSTNDSIERFEPSKKTNTLYVFTDIYTIPDSILQYADSLARDISVAMIRLSVDTFGWHKDARRFSKEVKHFWAVGGVADSRLECFNVTSVPYFVVADSTARQIYRGAKLPVLP